jgi:hypothetical protein
LFSTVPKAEFEIRPVEQLFRAPSTPVGSYQRASTDGRAIW